MEKLCRRHRFALVHALRIPYEGIIAAIAELHVPMVVSTWGSDLKLQADGRVASHARETLARCDGFMADSSADVQVAEAFGLSRSTPRLVVPGNMGLDLAVFRRLLTETGTGSATRPPVVVYPRGVSPYVDHETFLDAIPRVLERRSDARIICLGLRRSQSAVRRAESLGSAVTVANFLPQEDLWRLYARASVVVSPALSDGTPNSVIEAAALGAIPVVSDLPWVGEAFAEPAHCYSVEQGNPEAMAQAIVQALAVPGAVRQRNIDTMAARFGAEQSLDLVIDFYAELVQLRHHRHLADWLAGTRELRRPQSGSRVHRPRHAGDRRERSAAKP
ncbi:glycosyltransferase family 4 protein [Actinopolymorpha pittospori]